MLTVIGQFLRAKITNQHFVARLFSQLIATLTLALQRTIILKFVDAQGNFVLGGLEYALSETISIL